MNSLNFKPSKINLRIVIDYLRNSQCTFKLSCLAMKNKNNCFPMYFPNIFGHEPLYLKSIKTLSYIIQSGKYWLTLSPFFMVNVLNCACLCVLDQWFSNFSEHQNLLESCCNEIYWVPPQSF